MSLMHINAESVKQYLPDIKFSDNNFQVPVLSKKSLKLFREIQPSVPYTKTPISQVIPLDWKVKVLINIEKYIINPKFKGSFADKIRYIFFAINPATYL